MLSFLHFINEALVHKVHTVNNDDEIGADINIRGSDSANKHKQDFVHKIPISRISTHEPLHKTNKDSSSDESETNIQSIIKGIKRGDKIEPIKLRRHGKTGNYQVLDGHHRLEAHKRLGVKHISANIIDHYHITSG